MLNYLTGERSRYGRNLLVSYTLPNHELLLPTRMHTSFEGFWEVNRQESVAGRDTLVVDLFGFNPTSTEASGDIANVPLHSGGGRGAAYLSWRRVRAQIRWRC